MSSHKFPFALSPDDLRSICDAIRRGDKLEEHKANAGAARLRDCESPKLKAVSDAFADMLTETLSPEERRLIDLIEERRSALLNSDREIDVIDYGAGSRESVRTREEMEKGFRSTRRVADICRASKSQFWATLLFKLIRKLQPLSCVELGSCVGISAAYQATALAMNGKGSLITLEGSPGIAGLAEETFRTLNLQNVSVVPGPFHETLGGVLKSAKPVDFFFNDGHHDHDAVLRYLNESVPFLADEAVILFDDISWSPGMIKAWAEIENDPRMAAAINLQALGIALLGRRSEAG